MLLLPGSLGLLVLRPRSLGLLVLLPGPLGSPLLHRGLEGREGTATDSRGGGKCAL